MQSINSIALFLLVLFGLNPFCFAGSSQEPRALEARVVMGWLESVFIMPWGRRFTAKLDTGASSSSLHTDKVEHFKKNGAEWVRFRLEDFGEEEKEFLVGERPLLRTAFIKNHNKMSSKRDVVMLTVCKNGKEYQTEFNLVDRSNFNYPVLLGRSFLKDVALVDPAATFLFKGEKDDCAKRRVGSSPGK